MTECNCNLQCDPITNAAPAKCCHSCSAQKERRDTVPEPWRSMWREATGFWRPDGCVLPMEQRPQQCREYDCHEYVHVAVETWNGKKWRSVICSVKESAATSTSMIAAALHAVDIYWFNKHGTHIIKKTETL